MHVLMSWILADRPSSLDAVKYYSITLGDKMNHIHHFDVFLFFLQTHSIAFSIGIFLSCHLSFNVFNDKFIKKKVKSITVLH